MSVSGILGPIDYFSDIENLVLFERAMFADYDFKYSMIINIPIFNVTTCITTLKYMPKES